MRPKQLKAKDLRAFAIVPIRALKDPRITPATFRVLAAFCSYADHMGRTFVSQTRIGQDVGLSQSGVSWHVVRLRKFGYMTHCKPFYKDQKSTSNRIVYDPQVKLEETIRSRLTPKQQIQLGEAEAMLKQEGNIRLTGINTWSELDLLVYMEKFECLARDFFTAAIADGWVIKHEKLRRGAAMLANQAVELLSAPYSDEEAAA
jgi:hypothetical protein